MNSTCSSEQRDRHVRKLTTFYIFFQVGGQWPSSVCKMHHQVVSPMRSRQTFEMRNDEVNNTLTFRSLLLDELPSVLSTCRAVAFPLASSYVAGACGPLVQQLGMDEIFADITTLIEAKGTTADSAENVDISTTARTTPAADETTKISAQSTQARAQRSPGKSFTGHLYSPGTGGHLLEAQTGLEISLGTGSTSGDIRSRREIDNDRPYRENAGDMINHCETRFLGANSRTFGATGLSANPRMTDCAIGDADETMVVSDQNDGIASSDVRSSEQRKISETAAFVDQEASSECAGRCRCGCIERLAAASAFAERVRRGLRDEVKPFRFTSVVITTQSP